MINIFRIVKRCWQGDLERSGLVKCMTLLLLARNSETEMMQSSIMGTKWKFLYG